MQIKIKTLTPLWTGDVERKSTKLRETSIIGSLRWWFEAIVRGFGGYACDPTSNEKCELKEEELKKGKKPEELICPVCYIFGTTGWSKRFRIEIDRNSYQSVNLNLATDSLRCNYSPLAQNVKWWLEQTLGSINPKVIVSTNDKGIIIDIITDIDIVGKIIYLTFKTIEKFGALGSHNTYGLGIIKVLEPSNINVDEALNFINEYRKRWNIDKYCEEKKLDKRSRSKLFNLPNLKHAFKIDFELSENLHNKNIGFILKYTLRNYFKEKYNKGFAEQLFGSKKDRNEKFSGKIFVSNCWEEDEKILFRVYGMFFPSILNSKEDIINTIKECVRECLNAEIESEVSWDLEGDKYITTRTFKKMVMKNE